MGCCEGRPERPDDGTIENPAVRTSAWTETFFAVFPPSVRFYPFSSSSLRAPRVQFASKVLCECMCGKHRRPCHGIVPITRGCYCCMRNWRCSRLRLRLP